jgi:O-acetyl-ADP-ribose deacetylase (regulator of RNase III)
MKIEQGDITRAKVDCIINPANGLGVMHKGISSALNRVGGPEVENSSKEACFYHGLYKPGEAYWGSSGQMKVYGIKAICHAVIIYRHPEKIKRQSVWEAVNSSLVLIREAGYKSFAIPAIGNEPRSITARDCAEQTMMLLAPCMEEFDIHVIDRNKEFIDACKDWRKGYGK